MKREYNLTAEQVYQSIVDGTHNGFLSDGWSGLFTGRLKDDGEVYISFSCGEEDCCWFDYEGHKEWMDCHEGDMFCAY